MIHVTLVAANLKKRGSETDMVMDFGFVKQMMLDCIAEPCDHAMIVDAEDAYLMQILDIQHAAQSVHESKQAMPLNNPEGIKIYLVPFSPTSEALAQHWYRGIKQRIQETGYRAEQVRIESMRVYETPNCWAEYTENLDL